MLEKNAATNNSDPMSDAGHGASLADHTRELSAFQRDILVVLAAEARYGLAVKRELEQRYDTTINHGRLYPNLDTLAERGLVEKSQLDSRTNEYQITDAGLHFLIEHTQRLLGVVRGDEDE